MGAKEGTDDIEIWYDGEMRRLSTLTPEQRAKISKIAMDENGFLVAGTKAHDAKVAAHQSLAKNFEEGKKMSLQEFEEEHGEADIDVLYKGEMVSIKSISKEERKNISKVYIFRPMEKLQN